MLPLYVLYVVCGGSRWTLHCMKRVDEICASNVCVCVCVCVCRPISYFIMHIQTMHPTTHRATYILARDPMNAENPVGP